MISCQSAGKEELKNQILNTDEKVSSKITTLQHYYFATLQLYKLTTLQVNNLTYNSRLH